MSAPLGPKIGHFYFISPRLAGICPYAGLMDLSKGEMKDRPCLCVAKNPGPGVFWMVPLSSKIEKYMKIYKSKLEKRGVCDTIVFGYVLGCKKAFLIQNIFPVTVEFVKYPYLGVSGNPILCGQADLQRVLTRANKILSLESHGFHIVFTDIEGMLETLCGEKFRSSRIEAAEHSI